MKNIKLCFFSLLSLFFFFPIFFFFTPSSHASLADSTSSSAPKGWVYPSKHWREYQQVVPTILLKYAGTNFWVPFFLGLKKLKFQKNGKEVVYYFDKIVPALYEQMRKQQKTPLNMEFTNFNEEGKKQIWQFFEEKSVGIGINNGIGYNEELFQNINKKLKTYLNSALNSIKPLLLKMKVLNIWNWVPSWAKKKDKAQSPYFLLIEPNFEFTWLKNDKDYWLPPIEELGAMEELKNFIFGSKSFDSSIPHVTHTINLVTNPWLHILQKTKGLDFTHLVVGEEKIDVSSLVNSKVKQVSELSISDLKIIRKLQTTILNFLGIKIVVNEQDKKIDLKKALDKLESIVQSFINTKLKSYESKTPKTNKQTSKQANKTQNNNLNIWDTLKDFANTKIKKIQIQGINYQVEGLLQKAKNQLVDSSKNTKDELLPLARAKISPETLKNALLESYYSTIVQNLNALQNENVFEFQINDKTYFLTELNKQINKNKNFLSFNAKTKTELIILAKNGITKTQLDNVLTKVSKVKTDNKKLMIGLSVGGGIVVFPSFAWFLYWLFKPRK